ncbi:MAG: redoxin domain-containing protein [Bryobacterales bacterium]|nr:redoxin domain-containing protein [Bryobacterales bacterium]
MKHKTVFTVTLLAMLAFLGGGQAKAAAKVGSEAPAFRAKDMNGESHTLTDYTGKYVVLEWVNHGCPFVGKQYGSGNMQALQKEWRGKGVVWLSVITSAPGEQGHSVAAKAKTDYKTKGSNATTVLLDETGVMGKAYGAMTTPHMFIIDPSGKLIYNGAIDDKPTTDLADVKTAQNYVSAALREAMAGKAVSTPTSQPYGCAVKY